MKARRICGLYSFCCSSVLLLLKLLPAYVLMASVLLV
jgi:hypothetical protein